MKKKFQIGLIGTSLLLFISCGKTSIPIEEGIYSGTFTVKYFVEMPWVSGSGETTLELRNGEYTCTGNSDLIPAGGSGNYSLKNSRVIFNEEHGWLANFDWGLILNGEYDYIFDGKRLKIWIKSEVGLYEYDLTKQLGE